MASLQKYFLALVPEGNLQEKATSLKEMLKEQFNIKYALKSPAHITLKMPFSYNEAKEEYLIERLKEFLKDY
jgi:2'-5' RNA ligase